MVMVGSAGIDPASRGPKPLVLPLNYEPNGTLGGNCTHTAMRLRHVPPAIGLPGQISLKEYHMNFNEALNIITETKKLGGPPKPWQTLYCPPNKDGSRTKSTIIWWVKTLNKIWIIN